MTARLKLGRRPFLDSEPLTLGRRAAYRRILALIGAQPSPYVIGGAFGLSLQLGRLVDGELEVCMGAEDVPAALEAVNAAGLSIERDDSHRKARLAYGNHRAVLRWALPSPLFGGYDDVWFARARRTRFLGLRVRVAPVEELLWLRIAGPSGASLADPLVGQILLAQGAELDWDRLRSRMAGHEALLLAHVFLFWHQYPESARRVVPAAFIDDLRLKIDQPEDGEEVGADSEETEEAGNVEDQLAAESLHGGP
jgi:hypothetical protein